MTLLPSRPAGDTTLRWIGLDLAKRESQLVTLNADGEQIAALRFPTTRENIQLLRAELTAFDTIALEVTTNSNAITRLLQQSPAKILTSNPIRTKMIASAKINTDKIDARVLAELARPALYGSGLKGKQVKVDIARLAAEQSEAIYQAIVAQRQQGQDATPVLQPLGFDPTRPLSADWQRVLEKVAERYVELLARVPQPPISD